MASEEAMIKRGARWRQAYSEQRYAMMLMFLTVLLAGPPILFGFGFSGAWYDVVLSLLILAAILSLCAEPRQRRLALILGIPPIVLSFAGHSLPGTAGDGVLFVGHLCQLLFLFGAAALIAKTLFNAQSLTFDSIFGALCGYLFLGLGWAVLYSMIEHFRPGSFAISESLAMDGEPARALPPLMTYYSFVTLTTVGYGDMTPVTSLTCTFSWIEAITGQFYLAVIVAGLVSILASRKRPV